MRIHRFATAAGAIACGLATGAVALAASTPVAGPVRMFLTYRSPTRESILVTGTIADYGTAIAQDASGKVDPNGDFEKVTLRHGGFVIDATALTRAIQRQFKREPIDQANCSLALTGTGPSTIESGTGAYTGISGTLKITLTIAGIAPKTRDGKCNLSTSAPFYGQYQAVTATGRVSVK